MDDKEIVKCWRCGAAYDECCCGERSPLTFEGAIDILNELHLRGLLEDFPILYPNKIEELDFED